MTAAEREILLERAAREVGVNSALMWLSDVEHLSYLDARDEIRRRIYAILEAEK